MASEKTTVCNFSDDELILTKYKSRCQSLENQISEMLGMRENIRVLNVRNEHISKRLLKLKTEYEHHKADLCKTLFNLKLASDKQQILSKGKINEFLEKRKNLQEYMSPFKMELDELIDRNNHLQEQWRNVISLLDLTKTEYKEILNFLLKTFRMKVCEFCDTAIKLKAVTY